jgi:hypothetical protein
MNQAVSEKITIWRRVKENAFAEMVIPREEVQVGDVVYDTSRKIFGHILEFIFKEPGRYSDMEFVIRPDENFFVFPKPNFN